jgi:hypothetical protein
MPGLIRAVADQASSSVIFSMAGSIDSFEATASDALDGGGVKQAKG